MEERLSSTLDEVLPLTALPFNASTVLQQLVAEGIYDSTAHKWTDCNTDSHVPRTRTGTRYVQLFELLLKRVEVLIGSKAFHRWSSLSTVVDQSNPKRKTRPDGVLLDRTVQDAGVTWRHVQVIFEVPFLWKVEERETEN